MLASGGLFAMRISGVLKRVFSAKPEPGYSLRPIGRRVWDFLWEVMLQGKVIWQRPLPGIAHAFVFWGFCAFALITLNHFAAGLGSRFSPTGTPFSQFYFWLAALFAVAVSVSIAGLAFRRFVVRPRWLGEKVSIESGFIAFLIFTLMVTYLATFWIPEDTTGGKSVWWAHTLALLIFMPLIPHTKHLHLVLSPITIFLKRQRFSQIPPLEGDEDFGLDTGKDLTNVVALQAYSCVECGRCTEHCPANFTGKILNPNRLPWACART
jgi:NAD-dependent dihydropyrimidine dehydrogenase PreA subunit